MPKIWSAKIIACIRRGFAACVFGLGILVMLLAIGEIGANVYLDRLPMDQFKRFASVSQYEKKAGHNFQFSYQGGFGIYPTPGYTSGLNKHNRMGYRGGEIVIPKPPGVFRIACLGGSTTYDVAIDDCTRTWPADLQNVLQERGFAAEVVNAGVPSWTSREQILNYATRISYLQPDLIVIYDGINDLLLRATWPPEQLRSDYTNPFVIAPEFARQPWYTSLTLLRIPLILTGCLMPPCAIDPFWCDTIKSQGFVNLTSTVSRPRRLPLDGRECSIPPGMTLRDVFAATPTTYFARNVSSVISCAKSEHTNVVLVGFVLNWQVLQQKALDGGEGLQLGIGQINAALETIGRDCNVPYYDLPRDWPQEGEYWADFAHNNEQGALLKARMIADFIVRAGIVS